MIGNTNAGQTIPSVNNPTITFMQGGVSKGDITLNQSSNETIALDGNGFSKLTGTIATSDWQGGSGGCFLDGQDLSTWEVSEATPTANGKQFDQKLGLVAGETYTLNLTVGGVSQTATFTAFDGAVWEMDGTIVCTFTDQQSWSFVIFDGLDLSTEEYGVNKCYVYGNPTLVITSITGAGIGGGGGYTATISNNAIKVNSSVDMFVNTALNFTAEKSEGAITLTSSTQPSDTLNYVLEVIDTPSESALSVFNLYKPSSISETDAKSLIGQNMFFTNDSTSPATVYGGTWTELGTMSVGSSTIHCWKRS